MQRRFGELAAKTFDLLIIGGGISGATILWDATLRGLDVALVEKSDYGGATSAATGKLIHGGLRYLKSFQLRVVRESLRERRIFELIAPHQVSPLPFVLPLYSLKDSLMLKAGMVLYDMLGFDKKRLDDPAKRIPNHRCLKREEVLELFPTLPEENLRGGLLYYDCQMICPERLTFSFIKSACKRGATASNWAELIGFEREGGGIVKAQVRDVLTGENTDVQARSFVNASGGWADEVLGLLSSRDGESHRLVRSKGIHVLLEPLHATHALAMITRSKRHVYLLPWRGLTLAGTTDKTVDTSPDELTVSSVEISDFLSELNDTLPNANYTPEGVIAAYGGLRPLADDDGVKDSYAASRRFEVADHSKDGLADNLLSALGGKYTTARALAEGVVDKVFEKLQRPCSPCLTAETLLEDSPSSPIGSLREQIRQAHPELADDVVTLLVSNYGSECESLLKLCESQPELLEPLWDGAEELAAQIVFAAREESAARLEDALFRRTGLCTVRRPPVAVLERCVELMGDELGWSELRRAEELERVTSILDG